MNDMPFEGKNGRVYKFGEFFPLEISPYAYNESTAYENSPLTASEIKNRGYNYRESEEKNYKIDLKPEDLPEDIKDVNGNFLENIIGCEHEGDCLHQCTTAFRIHPEELSFYKNFKLPLSRLCPNCRYYKRLEYRKPWKLWQRTCMCENEKHDHTGKCQNKFQTPYDSDRLEKIYCEECYNKEVY